MIVRNLAVVVLEEEEEKELRKMGIVNVYICIRQG